MTPAAITATTASPSRNPTGQSAHLARIVENIERVSVPSPDLRGEKRGRRGGAGRRGRLELEVPVGGRGPRVVDWRMGASV
jgi:hypothetical protein